MTTYVFSPASATATQNWSDPTIWSPHSVPNAGTAEVLLPEIIVLQTGQPAALTVQIQTGQSFQVSDLTVLYDTVANSGTLTVAHALTVGPQGGLYEFNSPGTYVAQTFENDGLIESSAPFKISGAAINRGGMYGDLTLTAATFDNLGSLEPNNNLTIAVTTPNGFVNLSGGVLTGGTYYANLSGRSLTFQVNQPITTLGATVVLAGTGLLQTYAATGTSLVPLQSSLATIAPSGVLVTGSSYANAGALTVAGTVLNGGASLSAATMTLTPTGSIAFTNGGSLSANGGIIDNGNIFIAVASGFGYYTGTSLVVGSAVQGNGAIVIGPAKANVSSGVGGSSTQWVTASLELASSDTANIVFTDAMSSLTLDMPGSVSGTILGFTKGNSITLSGISLSSVVKTTYSGDTTHGTLSILESNGTTLSLALQGNYSTAGFSLAAGPQVLSTSPPSVILTDTVPSAVVYTSLAGIAAAVQAGTLTAGSVAATSAADVAANIDALQARVASGQVSHVALTDTDQTSGVPQIPVMTLTATQFIADAAALQSVAGAFSVSITGANVTQAESIAGGAHISSLAVSDSAAHIAPQLDALQTLAATGQVSSIAVTDSGFVTVFLSSAQLAGDRVALTEMSGNFNLSVAASAANLELDGISGHALSAVFSGTAGQYSIAAVGDGVGVTITDSGTGRTSVDLLRSVTAIQFSDVTDLVAKTPGAGSAGAVTTGNVAELYGAVFGRQPDLPGLAYYQNILAQNPSLPLTTFAQWFLASPEYANNPAHNYAQSSAGDTQFITDSYNNLLHRAPESGAVPYYLTIINLFTNGLTPGTSAYAAAEVQAHAVVLSDFSASAEFLQDVQVTAQTPSSAQHWLILA